MESNHAMQQATRLIMDADVYTRRNTVVAIGGTPYGSLHPTRPPFKITNRSPTDLSYDILGAGG